MQYYEFIRSAIVNVNIKEYSNNGFMFQYYHLKLSYNKM